MIIELTTDYGVTLRAETDEDKKLLEDFSKHGIIVSHTGSTTGIVSLKTWAGGQLRAFYLDRDQHVLLAYALGRIHDLRHALHLNDWELLSKILPTEKHDEES